MSDNHRKLYSKKGTGTVPKVKYGNNTSVFNQDETNHVSNNLVCSATTEINTTLHAVYIV